jgi:YaiO family outer membrane protein
MKKAKILMAMGREEEAREILAQLFNAYPNSPEVKKALAGLNKYKNRVALEHTFDFFNKPYKYRWHMSSLQYQHEAKWGSTIGKLNMGKAMVNGNNSFKDPDFQIEADAYPILSSNLYLYLNYGYSWGDFFPRHRAGIEPFLTLPHNWEVSAGGRFLYYDTEFGGKIDVYILTASISKYYKSHWISFRPYYVFIGNSFAQSYYLYYRHYYKSAYNYLGGALGIGNSPDDPSIRSGDVSRLSIDSYTARIDFQHLLGTRFLFRSFTGVSFEKYAPDAFRPRFSATLYIAYLF